MPGLQIASLFQVPCENTSVIVNLDMSCTVARQSTTVYKAGVAPNEYRVHEACIGVVRQSTTVYKHISA